MQKIALRVRLQECQKNEREKRNETNGKLYIIVKRMRIFISFVMERETNCNSNNNKIIKVVLVSFIVSVCFLLRIQNLLFVAFALLSLLFFIYLHKEYFLP